ncbi:hypothetical protein Esti_001212 [Eimeria stiedai]
MVAFASACTLSKEGIPRCLRSSLRQMSAFPGALTRRGGVFVCLLLLLQQQQQATRVAAAGDALAPCPVSAAPAASAAAASAAAAPRLEGSLPFSSQEAQAAPEGKPEDERPSNAVTARERETPPPEELESPALHRFNFWGFGISVGKVTPAELQRIHQTLTKGRRASRAEGLTLILQALLIYIVAQGLRARESFLSSGVALDLMEKGAGILAALGFVHVLFLSVAKLALKKGSAQTASPGATKREAFFARAGRGLHLVAIVCTSVLALTFLVVLFILFTLLIASGATLAAEVFGRGVARTFASLFRAFA